MLDDSKLQVDAVKAGEKAGQSLGQRMSTNIGGAVKKTALAGLTAGFAMATKGLVELEDVTANYRRETGATADEAEKAGKAINAMAGRNLQPMEEIGATLAAVHTQMGLTGDAAEKTTERFLKFGRATGQDSTEAVRGFDKVLKAWGLTARDANGLMDKLVKAHEKFGISVTGSEEALGALAPQLKALNLSVDDAIGLLDLFKSAGLDASIAQKALNSAITKLPKGETLQAFLAHLATIPDAGKRAQEAMTVFGKKAGAGIANAIRPGVDSLDAFKISTNEAAGAMDRAADVADSTLGNRIKKALNAFGAAMRGAFIDAGPLFTGIGGLATFAGALGIDELAKTFVPRLIAAMKAAGAQAGTALSDGLQSVWQGAAGTVIGNNIATRIENIFGPGATAIGRAWRAAGAKAQTMYLQALIAGDAANSALIGGLGTRWGGIAGKAAGVAFRLAFLLALPAIAQAAKDELNKIHLFGDHPPLEGLKDLPNQLPWPLGTKDPPDWAVQAGFAKKGADMIGTATLDALLNPLRDVGGKITDFLAKGLEDGSVVVRDGALVVVRNLKPLIAGVDNVGAAMSRAWFDAKKLAKELRDQFVSSVNAAVDALTQAVYGPAQLTGALASLADQLIADQKHLHDLAKIKNPTEAQRRDILETKGRIAETNSAILKTRVDLALLNGTGMGALVKELKGLAKQTGAVGDAARNALHYLQQVHDLGGDSKGSKYHQRVAGGYVPAGWTGTVGEEGIEGLTMFPGGGGFVTPRAQRPTPAIASGASVPSVVNYYYQNTAHVEGLVKATNPLDIARELGRFARNGQFVPKPRRTA